MGTLEDIVGSGKLKGKSRVKQRPQPWEVVSLPIGRRRVSQGDQKPARDQSDAAAQTQD